MSAPRLRRGPLADGSVFTETMVDLPWPAVERAARERQPVLLPVGIVEAHGPHLDLSPDIYLGYLACRFLRRRLADGGTPTIIGPPLYWGVSEDLKRYPGTFSVRPETLRALLLDVYTSLDSWGFTHAFVVNAHGDPTHREMIRRSRQDAREQLKVRVHDLSELDVPLDDPPALPPPRPGRFEEDYHAGAGETAAMHLYFPDRVDTAAAESLPPQRGFHPLGYYGDPASWALDAKDLVASLEADTETDARKIEAVLRGVTPRT